MRDINTYDIQNLNNYVGNGYSFFLAIGKGEGAQPNYFKLYGPGASSIISGECFQGNQHYQSLILTNAFQNRNFFKKVKSHTNSYS